MLMLLVYGLHSCSSELDDRGCILYFVSKGREILTAKGVQGRVRSCIGNLKLVSEIELPHG